MGIHEALIVNNVDKQTSKLSFDGEESLLFLCKKAGLNPFLPCAGNGRCGRCIVSFEYGAPLPTSDERRLISPDGLRSGKRLLCSCRVSEDFRVFVTAEPEYDIVDGEDVPAIRIPDGKDEADGTDETDITDEAEGYVVVTDIGTTTVVMKLKGVSSGKIFAVYKALNPQGRYGADVMTRMSVALSGKGEELKGLIRGEIERGIADLCGSVGISSDGIKLMTVTCNTVMMHLFMGYPVDELSVSPFTPYTYDEVETDIRGLKTIVIPCFSGFVGGDIYSDLLMTGNEPFVLVDLGTNAEIVVFDGKKAYASSAAAGSAMDKDGEKTMYASERIGILAKLFKDGIIDEHGTYVSSGPENVIPKEDIRSLQLAKSAVRSGIEILLKKSGLKADAVKHVYLAGGAGKYLDGDAAVLIGMFPGEFAGKIQAKGNMAVSGAYIYAKAFLSGEDKRIPYDVMPVNLAMEEDFGENFINFIDLG